MNVPRSRDILSVLAVTAAYLVAGKIGLSFASVHPSASAVWPPTGIALAALLLLGYRIWPAILLGAFLVNITTAGTPATSLGIAVGNTLEGVLGCFLVRHFARGRQAFDSPSSIFKFAVLGGMVSPALGATIGVTTLSIGRLAPWSDFGPIWATWWLGDAAGALIVTPLVMLWCLDPKVAWSPRQRAELALLFVTLIVLALFVFSGLSPIADKHYPIQYFCLPPLFWGAFRFGQRESATAIALLSGMAIQGTLGGHGPFSGRPPNESFLLLQGFMAVFAVTVLGTAAAVVSRRRVEASVRQMNEGLEAANRLKDEFLAMLSHELRTPLNAIAGWANLLKSGALDAATTSRAVETIERNVKIQAHLISDILDISRMTSGRLDLNFRLVPLATVIEGALDTMKPMAEAKRVELRPELADLRAQVHGDPDRLQQIVWNLLSNAIKFAPEGSHVSVRAKQVGGSAEILVEDDGPGIDPDFLPHVFERFRQWDSTGTRRHGGLGLGLTIVSRLVELHGGTVSASNRDGGGARFVVTLPLAETSGEPAHAGAATGKPAPANGAWPRLRGQRILLVEDDQDSRELTAMFLSECGAEVVAVPSAAEALSSFAASPPDLLISDIAMPEKSGYDLIREVRSLSREMGGTVPALALTAYAGREDVAKALDAGFDVHVAKPVEMSELAGRLEDLLTVP